MENRAAFAPFPEGQASLLSLPKVCFSQEGDTLEKAGFTPKKEESFLQKTKFYLRNPEYFLWNIE
jgi:hypothetical protein